MLISSALTHPAKPPPKGFSLLELQISIALLAFGVAGMSVVMMNSLRQLRWLESRRPIQSHVPKDLSRVIFTETTSPSQPSRAVHRVQLIKFEAEDSKKLKAWVALLDRSP